MRSYPHRPDDTFLRAKLDEVTDRIERTRARATQKVADGKLFIFSTLVDDAFTRTCLAWGLEEPLPTVTQALDRTTSLMGDGLDRGFTPGAVEIDRWLGIALIGADRTSAIELASRFDAGVDGFAERGEVSGWFVHGLIALLRNRPDAATDAARALSQWFDSPAASPQAVAAYGSLDRLIAAVAANDQAAFEVAAAERAANRSEIFGASAELRRHTDGLIDAFGAAVARLALLRGITVPVDNPYLAGELLSARPWPAEG